MKKILMITLLISCLGLSYNVNADIWQYFGMNKEAKVEAKPEAKSQRQRFLDKMENERHLEEANRLLNRS